jgi:hypothetical protein
MLLKKMISLNTSISDTCQKLWQGLSAGAEREPEAGAEREPEAGAEREPEAGALAGAGRWPRRGAGNGAAQVISRSGRAGYFPLISQAL